MSTEDVMIKLPCLFCNDEERARAVRARLGQTYLDLEAGRLPKVPTRAELFRGCCKQIQGFSHSGASSPVHGLHTAMDGAFERE